MMNSFLCSRLQRKLINMVLRFHFLTVREHFPTAEYTNITGCIGIIVVIEASNRT